MIPASCDSLWPDADAMGAATDLYQLTMAAGYSAAGKGDERAIFELFVRKLPTQRSFLILAGLEQAISELVGLRFSEARIDEIRSLPIFRHTDPTWFDELSRLRFQGDLWAVPEGTAQRSP